MIAANVIDDVGPVLSRMEATWFSFASKKEAEDCWLLYLPRYISIILSWSTYSKIWGASIRIPTVPAVVTKKNMYSWSLSITIATYFQSSLVWKEEVTIYYVYSNKDELFKTITNFNLPPS